METQSEMQAQEINFAILAKAQAKHEFENARTKLMKVTRQLEDLKSVNYFSRKGGAK